MASDHIEANHLTITSKAGHPDDYWLNIIFTIGFLALGLIKLNKVDLQFFLSFDYFKSILSSKAVFAEFSNSIYGNFFIAFLFWTNLFPRYNFLSRWLISFKHSRNFVGQEPKTLSIKSDRIEVVSENHRKSMQWQDFSHFQENKQIFLLHGSLFKVIIPKRAFNSEELANMTSFFASKIN